MADAQAAATWHVSYAQAQPGDLVFFDSPDVGHVGIYLGGGMMLDAPHTGAFVRIEPIWWRVAGRLRPGRLSGTPRQSR